MECYRYNKDECWERARNMALGDMNIQELIEYTDHYVNCEACTQAIHANIDFEVFWKLDGLDKLVALPE